MREVVRWRSAERFARGFIEVARDREEALRTEEPAARHPRQPARPERDAEPTSHHFKRARVIDRHVSLAAAGLVVAGERRDALEQGRFPAAILANDDRDG